MSGIIIETLFFNYKTLYRSTTIPRIQFESIYRQINHGRYAAPSKHPFYQLVNDLKSMYKDDKTRWISTISDLDNLAWVVDGHAVLGYDGKPLMNRMQKIITIFMKDWPYQMWSKAFPANFLKNMNVGYILAWEGTVPGSGPLFRQEKGTPVYRLMPQDLAIRADGQTLTSSKLLFYSIKKPLPYVYTQNHVVVQTPENQMNNLLLSDLSKAVYIDKELKYRIPNDLLYPINHTEIGFTTRFSDLQAKNKILTVDRHLANSLYIEAVINKPAILIIAENWHPGWKASINGRSVPLFRVNYLQQGILVEKGINKIKLSFIPQSLIYGGIVSCISLIMLIAVGIIGYKHSYQ